MRLRDVAALAALRERLRAAGVPTRDDVEVAGQARCFADDPWGNRIELVASHGP